MGTFLNGIDLGCSGNSILYFLDNIVNKSYLDLADLPLKQYKLNEHWHPVCSDLSKLPYRNGSFDFVSAISILEHVKNDEMAISEINRITKEGGIILITVPHRMEYFTLQDTLIGHYRRYEVRQIVRLFIKNNMKVIEVFGIYGQLMRISDVQSLNPAKIEDALVNLRNKYELNLPFRLLWSIFVWFGSKIMKIDAKYQRLNKIMNIAFMFRKQ